MTELLVVAIVVVLVLTNGGLDWIKAHLPANWSAQTVVDKAKAIQTQVVQDLTPIKQDGDKMLSDIHTLVDNWVALCKIPGIASDPEALKAMDVLKGKILSSALPKAPTQ
jgi:hypothetical protein